MNGNVKKAKRKSSDKIKRNEDEKQRLRKKLKFDINKKVNRKKDIIFNIGSKGFTLIELIATIAIIAIISTIAIISITSLINSTREKSLQTAYSSLKETAATLSKELSDDYWDIDGNTYVSCVSVRDMKNEGYYKEDDFSNVDGINDSTFVIVKKDMDSKVIISSEIDADDSKYCSNNFNNANLKVKSYTPSTVTVEADCGSDNYNYSYSYSVKGANDFKNSNSENKNSKVHTFTGLKSNTEYDLRVICTKDSSANKIGNANQTTGKSNVIDFADVCTPNSVPITITYKDGEDYYFKLTSTGSIDSKYEAKECTEIGGSCLSNTVTSIRSNTWYKVNNKDIKVSINNNGNIYVYSSGNDTDSNGNSTDIKFSSSATATITKIDKITPNAPTVTPSDGIGSGNWHKANYNIKLSGGVNSNNQNCKAVTYEYSTDNKNFNDVTDNPLNKNSEENQIYYFRTKAKNGNISSVISYNSKLDKTKPVCKISNISQIRKTHTSSVDMECTDKLSGIVSKNLSSSNFNTKNVTITSISSPQSISGGYKYTISFRADTRGTNSYIELKSNIISDNAENSNNTTKSNIFEVLPNTYTLTYNSNGCGNDCNPKTKTVTYGGKYGKLCTINKTGYKFSGWYTATTGGTKVTSSSIYNIESDQTLYARCSAKTVKVTFNKNDGSGDTASQSFTYGASGNRFGYNTDGSYKWGNSGQFGGWDRTGYTLLGWSTDSKANSKTYGVYSGVTDDWINSNSPSITLYAVWKAKTVNVTFNKNDGSGDTASQSFTYGASGNRFGYNTDGSYKWGNSGQFGGWDRTGYTLKGWSTSSNASLATYSTYSGVADGWINSNSPSITLYAVWSAKTYTIKYDANDGTGSMSDTIVTYGKNTTISSNKFEKNGYTFVGWITRTNGKDDVDYGWTGWSGTWVYDNGQYGISNNILKLYAVWKENAQTINGYRCSGSDLYYITTCGLGTGICNYTHKNDYERNGTVVRSKLNYNLSSCSNYQVNNSSTYTKTINRALSLVSSSNTIKIINDNNDSSSATVSKNVTIDTNGKTVTRTSTINVNSGYTLTMNGTGRIINTSSRVFSVSGTLKIQGGTYENKSNTNSDAIYLGSSGNIVLNDVNEINIWSDYGCGSAIMSDSSNSINVNATSAGIKLYGYCYGIWAKDATVNVTSSYNDSIYGVTNWIEAIKGYAIRAKNINFGSSNVYQNGSNYFNPGARSQSYTTNTSTFNVLYADGSINYKSGTLYSTYSYGKFQKDCYTSASCKNFGSTYTYKPYYTGISDTIGSVKGSIFTSVTPNISWGYGQYFTSSYDTLALRIVKTK